MWVSLPLMWVFNKRFIMGNSGIDRETGITHPTYPSQVSQTVLFPWSPSAPPLPLEYLAANVILLHL